jgi:hypothetical protein
MPRKKKATTEIVSGADLALVPKRVPINIRAILDQMVREQVEQALAQRANGNIPADFQPRDVANDARIRGNVFEIRKWTLYFEKWGCRMCRRKNVSHLGGGCCKRCHELVSGRLAKIKRDFYANDPEQEIERQINQITSRLRSAKALLGTTEE